MSTDVPQGTTPRLRSSIDALPTYKAGRRPPAGRAEAVKLSSNENPFPPLPGVLDAVAEASAMVNRYPDLTAGDLVEALAATFDVPVEHLATGTGSVGILQQIVQSTAGPGDEVVSAWRSFEAYPIVTQIAGARAVTVPLTDDERHDLPAMAAAVTERTRLVLLCTPNNPTGPAITRDELDEFLAQLPGDVLVVLDEAYLEFVRDPAVPDGLDLYRRHANVCVLRTFSKAHGLAGLRVGYAVAHAPVAEALRKTAVPFGVSIVAQAAAVASLAAVGPMHERVEQIVAERDRVRGALQAQGWTVPDSQANFVWLRLHDATPAFAAACEEAGVLTRPYGDEGVRITIGDAAANDRVLRIAEGLAPGGRGGSR